MSSTKERVASYEAHGLPNARIAEIVGVSASYVGQIQTEEGYAELLQDEKKKIKQQKEEEDQASEYIKLESTVLKSLQDNAPFAEFRDLTHLMSALISRKQKPSASIVNNTQHNNYVTLSLPTAVLPRELVLNAQKEIVAVGNKSLAPMPSSEVKGLFKNIQRKREAVVLEATASELNMEAVTTLPEDF
jgi:hypothetical protein